jgi:hypothetical protein
VGKFLIQFLLAGEFYGITAHQRVDDTAHGGISRVIFSGLDAVDRSDWNSALVGQDLIRPAKKLLAFLPPVEKTFPRKGKQIRDTILPQTVTFDASIKHF